MQTPNTPRGRETERLMLLWRKQNPDADPSAYNREWDAVYRKLDGTFSDKEDATEQGVVDTLGLDDQARRRIVELHHRSKKPRRPRETHAPTKGAFGKPKHLRRR